MGLRENFLQGWSKLNNTFKWEPRLQPCCGQGSRQRQQQIFGLWYGQTTTSIQLSSMKSFYHMMLESMPASRACSHSACERSTSFDGIIHLFLMAIKGFVHALSLASNLAGTETDRSRRTSLDSQSRNSSIGEHRSSSIKEGSSFQPVPEGQAVSGTDSGFADRQSNGSLQNFAEGDLLRSESVPFAGQPQVVHIAPRYPFHK